ncbi:transient receptor potential cation channel subfamily A member 1 homolog isoform X2 [Ruditapes philippinarum]|uniref:transient receptor potential cation channel subfamily A member 1 homolog isoform X2 n=1 Tax=Ruditapes philippinarum TaxID=129788 RepID=UPI00295ABB2E|nr:transient receptor potential cation channel subfamily A member 1 homolog isoform X2 [Ruditapes philippinarum]
MRPIHYAAEKGHSEVFRVLLDKTDQAEFENFYWNCLDLAINENQVEVAYAIFQTQNSEKWKIMLRSRSKHDDSDSKCVDTPMRKLIRKMPDVAKMVFDKCTQITRDKHFAVEFNYEFLDDTYYLGGWKETTHKKRGKVAKNVHDDLQKNKDEEKNQKTSKDTPYTKNAKVIKKNHPLMIIVKSKQTQLLDHPLVTALLRRKWIWKGLISTIVNFLLYLAFLVLLTGFAIDLRAPYQFNSSPSYTDVNWPVFGNEKIPKFAKIAQPGILITAVVVILIEFIELKEMFSGKVWLYLKEIENIVQWITCITAFIFAWNINGSDNGVGYMTPFQWICGTISVFFAWTNMLFIIQKFDWIGIYVVMLKRIIKMFTKFFLVFSLLIVAFAITFHCLFQNQQHFSTFWISLMKTTSMMIGGPDFVTIFLDETAHYDIISYVFFYGFMLLMAIVVINLLVGLAVSNIQEFQKKADHAKKRMQVKFTLELEGIATRRIKWLKKFTSKFKCLKKLMSKLQRKPEKTETFCPKKQDWLSRKYAESWKLSERHITAAMNTEKDDTSKVVVRIDTKMKALETKLETHMKHVDDQLGAILKMKKDDSSLVVARSDTKMKALETKLETRMKHVDDQLEAILDIIGSKSEEN